MSQVGGRNAPGDRSDREGNDEWNENYYIQCSAYAEMFEERTGKEIDQIAVLVVTEDGDVQEFVKNKSSYIKDLTEAITLWSEKNV